MCVSQFRRCVLAIIYARLYLIQGFDTITNAFAYCNIYTYSYMGCFKTRDRKHNQLRYPLILVGNQWDFEGPSKVKGRGFRSVAKVWLHGSEIRRSPVEVGSSLFRYLQGFIHSRWLFGISEPNISTV